MKRVGCHFRRPKYDEDYSVLALILSVDPEPYALLCLTM